MIEDIKNLKKVELHIHLDGSVLPSTLAKLSQKSEKELITDLTAPDKCENLSEYLTKFDLPISYMQTKDNLKLISKDLVDYFEQQNIIYAEVRFAPMFHTKNGLSYDEIVESVLEGLKSNNNVKCNLILCMMRGFDKKSNIETINTAFKYLDKGVCAIDLAGAEDKYPLSDYIDLFDIVKERKIPFTIHAGENGSFKEVELALNIGARRIGHGIHSIDNLNTLDLLKKHNVLLEVCPTSNVQTNSVDIYSNHPVKELFNQGVNICINTDNKTVSNISLLEEYMKLQHIHGFNVEDFKQLNLNAINGSFLNDDEKQKLIIKLQ